MDKVILCFALCMMATCLASTIRHKRQTGLTFANSYGSHMVLQRAPHRAVVWGFAGMEGEEVTLTMGSLIYTTHSIVRGDSIVWEVTMEPVEDEGPHVITVSTLEESIKIDDVLFGDVWFCSGQSNMVHFLERIDDPEPDLDDAVNYPYVRPFHGNTNRADEPLLDTPNPVLGWRVPDRGVVERFSAVCWLFGKHLYNTLKRPIGLIDSSWGGTRIEAWMSPQALSTCTNYNEPDVFPNTEHVLWNGMVHPFLNTTIYGAIWYQGESNAGNAGQYNCLLQSMIADWRETWHQRSGSTNPQFPFGVVQLAPNRENPANSNFPAVRWSQTGGYGYTPNPDLADVFLAVAIDLPDFNSPFGSIHPRYKRQIAERLALGAYQVAYGLTDQGRFQGPFPTELVQSAETISVIFDDGQVQLDIRGTGGFEVCCAADPSECEASNAAWSDVFILVTDPDNGLVVLQQICEVTTAIRYLWKESPCPLEQCAIYSVENQLPVPPFIYP